MAKRGGTGYICCVLTLYQAEWCPFSSAVRERLTELGIPFVARPVEPWPEQRTEVEEIPVLETEDGARHTGTRAILAFLATLPPGVYEVEHRRRWHEHADARRQDATGQILERAAPLV